MKDLFTPVVSAAVIRRLPNYLRILDDLSQQGIERISSSELSEKIGYTASQIRQDFNHFGGFGLQGYGYNIEYLKKEIRAILGLNREYRICVVGCGHLGYAVANFSNFYEDSFVVASIFDANPELIGQEIVGVKIQDVANMRQYLKENKMDIGVVTVPKSAAQEVADILVEGGVSGIWNFAPLNLTVPDDVVVNNVHLFDGLQSLTYYINH